LLIALITYGLLTRYYHPRRNFLDDETRCRKCGYILKGIKEPICSECGEKI
jgi:rubrerythrin